VQHPWTLVGLVVAGLVVISLWMWMNVVLVRKMQVDEASTNLAETGRSTDIANNPSIESPRQDAQPEQPPSAESTTVDSKDFAAAPEEEGEAKSDSVPPEPDVRDPEVWSDEGLDKRKVFGRSGMPFYIRNGVDSPFADPQWTRVFHMLKRDPRVLGWIAFHEDCMSAADHEYDDELVRVLVNYRASLENLRKEVGLSKVTEASLVGDEGKMWFVAGGQDTWFALFLDGAVEVDDILEPLLKPALLDPST
jgi:hypothetical protein